MRYLEWKRSWQGASGEHIHPGFPAGFQGRELYTRRTAVA